MLNPLKETVKSAAHHTDTSKKDITLTRIPAPLYQQMVDLFSRKYHFKNGLENGGRMRLANYYVSISRKLSNTFCQFIEEIINGAQDHRYPPLLLPDGFRARSKQLLPTEAMGSFSFGSFDMAVTEAGLKNIEFQAVATYPISAAKLSHFLWEQLPSSPAPASIFADHPSTNWEDFIRLYERIIFDGEREGVVLIDRHPGHQKTNFEFYATQKELSTPITILDSRQLFENRGQLVYQKDMKNRELLRVRRLYNRVLPHEACLEDNYPHDKASWQFRFDRAYPKCKFINHPSKFYEISKRLSPYLRHPYNPLCFELSESITDFVTGKLKFEEYVWKHKWGAAGQGLILSPSPNSLTQLSVNPEQYIAQKKVAYKIFRTDDGLEKIVELRFMTATDGQRTITVPMARIGHVRQGPGEDLQFRVHFSENNKEGYGFAPVLIHEEGHPK